MYRKPVIISVSSFYLKKEEIKLIKEHKPWGIILFQRNINSFKQLSKLTNDIRKCMKDPFYPILIDEEGGTVSRLNKLINTKEFSQNFFGKLYEKNKVNGETIYKYYLSSISSVLTSIGININTIPVMDLLQKKTHKILLTRCFSDKNNTVKKLGNICIKILKDHKIGSVTKHIPGHGNTNQDSHKKMPIVNEGVKKLISKDFLLFSKINSHFVMTAHVLYKKIDPINVATQSEIIIKKIIRKKLKYNGLIISDDICMKALKGSLPVKAIKSYNAGCNLILYCGGKIKESKAILKEFGKFDTFKEKKTKQFYQFLR